jgi:hypothetical protein
MTPSRQYTFSNSFATVPRERFPFVPLMRLIAKPFTGVKAIDDATLRLLRERKFKIEKTGRHQKRGWALCSLNIITRFIVVCVLYFVVCVCVVSLVCFFIVWGVEACGFQLNNWVLY